MSAAYLVCASQRSGSTLLVESLAATGVAGKPEEFFQYFASSSLSPQPREWFAGVSDPSLLDLLDPTDPGTVDTRTTDEWRADLLRKGATPNGVWGGKLMWNQTPLLLARTRSATGSVRTAIRSLFDGADPLYVHVHRPDLVGQAVSMWVAVQTRVWRGDAGEAYHRARYRADGIAHLAGVLRAQDQAWRDWFAAENITPLEVDFPTLTKEPTKATARVLEALGQDPDLAPPPPLHRQSDGRSAEWAARYRVDAAENGYPL
ncbi:trehalose 2-sulfotransferase [Nocardia camponoti]|uniref:Trehalose 2-sulfotransferase n=1 Tax=Nocardia camponoti TaxID=1616106 RepID=A0A917V499_9NOCA|nr:Stf0 family sulfotransferase [Nocardia camponoti]GGK34541.1 hypothetical protein GCM10011591_02740 [Nocardia camponoti]